MVKLFEEAGHLVFTGMSALNRGIMRRRKNKDSIHDYGESFNVDLLYRIMHSANQLCVYVAVTNWPWNAGKNGIREKRKLWARIESKTAEKSEHKHWVNEFFCEDTTSILGFGEPNASETSKFWVSCALCNTVEHGLWTRAIIDMRRQLIFRQWEETASSAMGYVCFTDCESLFSHDVSEYQKSRIIKRLAIDLSVLKQLIWDNRDDCGEEVDGSKGDYLRWIDTSAMLADCSTKTISAGIIDIRPIGESLAIKSQRPDSGGHRRKSRNHCKIPTIDRFTALVLNIGIARLWHDISENRHRSCGAPGYVGNVKSPQRRLMSQIALTLHGFWIPRTLTLSL